MMSVNAPSKAKASPKSSEALVEPTFMEASTSAPARSTTSPIEIRLTPVLTHESSVRSFARCSLISVSPCSCGSRRSLCGCKFYRPPSRPHRRLHVGAPERFLAARISALREPVSRIQGSVCSIEDGEYVKVFGDSVSKGDRLLDRRAGLEQEFFLVENSGHPSERADEFLKRCREESGGRVCFAPEFVLGLVE